MLLLLVLLSSFRAETILLRSRLLHLDPVSLLIITHRAEVLRLLVVAATISHIIES